MITHISCDEIGVVSLFSPGDFGRAMPGRAFPDDDVFELRDTDHEGCFAFSEVRGMGGI